ncbi:hypothetical protein K449DRAFT_389560 [Hypoxylon sp. EC38]|nr:hypothetical protein K449DRAFT_389560 [Hypoxylon sp. EC38]
MASSTARTPTYHVTPHFNIAAAGGALTLGTVVKDLLELAPLNKEDDDREPIPKKDIYPPTRQEGFQATRKQLQSGELGFWAKVAGQIGISGFGSAMSPKFSAQAGLSVNVPQALVAGEIKGDIKEERIQTLGFQSTDIVVGFRVKKCRYKKKHLFFGELKLNNELYIRGAQSLSHEPPPHEPVEREPIQVIKVHLAQQEVGEKARLA